MATDLTNMSAKIMASIKVTATKALDLSAPAETVQKAVSQSLAFGDGSDEADMIWHDSRTLAATTSENIDLAGTLVNAFGATITFSKVKAIFIHNNGDTAGVLEVGAAATPFGGPLKDAASDIITVPHNGMFLSTNPESGWTVTAGSADLLKINNTAAVIAGYDIVIVGVSA